MDEIEAALDLLAGIAHRDKIAPEEKVPAWRAIKLLYRASVPEEYCQSLVEGVRRLGSAAAFGPTLSYHVDGVRLMAARLKR